MPGEIAHGSRARVRLSLADDFAACWIHEYRQLLCGACNLMKGNRDQAYLVAALKVTRVL